MTQEGFSSINVDGFEKEYTLTSRRSSWFWEFARQKD